MRSKWLWPRLVWAEKNLFKEIPNFPNNEALQSFFPFSVGLDLIWLQLQENCWLQNFASVQQQEQKEPRLFHHSTFSSLQHFPIQAFGPFSFDQQDSNWHRLNSRKTLSLLNYHRSCCFYSNAAVVCETTWKPFSCADLSRCRSLYEELWHLVLIKVNWIRLGTPACFSK